MLSPTATHPIVILPPGKTTREASGKDICIPIAIHVTDTHRIRPIVVSINSPFCREWKVDSLDLSCAQTGECT